MAEAAKAPTTSTPAKAPTEVEKADAEVRALALDDADGALVIDDMPELGEPIQCIAKQKFFDERGALIKAGATYFYQEREGVPFPAKVLEPVSKAKAAAVRKEQRERDEEQAEKLRMQAARRAEFQNLIG